MTTVFLECTSMARLVALAQLGEPPTTNHPLLATTVCHHGSRQETSL
jgi:hypothetical protein